MSVSLSEKIRTVGDNLALNPLDPKDLISTFGLVGVWTILFAETGLLIGFFLPGDSLLFLAGVGASGVGKRALRHAAQPGRPARRRADLRDRRAQLGHFLGAKYGRRMFDRPNSRIFKPEYVEKAEYYFVKFGPAKAVVIARFIPIVRTFLNPVAGMLGMPAKTFLMWNIVGGILWTDGIIMAGYLLGDSIPAETIDRYLLPVVAVVVLLSVLPILLEFLRGRRAKKRESV